MRAILTIFLASLATSQLTYADHFQPYGTYSAQAAPSYYVSFDRNGMVTTNVGLFNGGLLAGTWIPTASIRHVDGKNYYFPASVTVHASGVPCTYSGKINIFVVNENEIDLTATSPSRWYLDPSTGLCVFVGSLTSTGTFRK